MCCVCYESIISDVSWCTLFFGGGDCGPKRGMASSFLRFLDHTQHDAVGRTSLYEWSFRRTDLYLTTHNTHNRQTSMPPAVFEPAYLCRRAFADLRLRPRGHCDREMCSYGYCNICTLLLTMCCFLLLLLCVRAGGWKLLQLTDTRRLSQMWRRQLDYRIYIDYFWRLKLDFIDCIYSDTSANEWPC